MPDWKDNLRPASYRGVPFMVPSHEASFGQRGEDHEYPGSDKGYREEMGRKLRTFTLEALVGGPDYLTTALQLQAACEKPGPGKLVHPYLGTMAVKCVSCTRTESTSEGGIARFSLEFVEANDQLYPEESTDYAVWTEEAVADVLGAVQDLFENIFDLTGPSLLGVEAVKDLQEAAKFARRIIRSLPGIGGPIETVLKGFSELSAQAESLIGNAVKVAEAVKEAIGGLADLAKEGSPLAVVEAALELAKFGEAEGSTNASAFGGFLPAIPAGSPAAVSQETNRTALIRLIRVTAAMEAAKAAVTAEYDSLDQALAVRSDLTELLDRLLIEIGDAGEDDLYRSLSEAYSAAIPAITRLGVDLPRIAHYTVPYDGASAVTLAYRLYGDVDRAEELIRRNRITNPAHIPGGTILEVLSA